MKKLSLLAFALLAACATPPERIKPTGVAGNCSPADRQRLADLTHTQDRTARNDALGVLMIGVPLGGEDHEPEIARLKGRCGVS